LADTLRQTGVDPVSFLRNYGIDAALITKSNERVPVGKILGMWAKAAAAAREPLFGLYAARNVESHTFGLVSYLATVSATWGEALELICRYFRLITDVGKYELCVVEGSATLLFVRRAGAPNPSHEFWDFVLSVPFSYAMRNVENFKVREILLPYPMPAHRAGIESYFAAPARFSAGSLALVFPEEYLKAPLKAADRPLANLLRSLADEKMATMPDASEPLSQLRNALRDALRAGDVTLAGVAHRLSVSPRNMQRQLRAAGTGFTLELNRARRELALILVDQPGVTLQQIAFRLGFSEQTAFQRAFRRWTGETPGHYREKGASQTVTE
jgi:AraC-like DNA-binding protein